MSIVHLLPTPVDIFGWIPLLIQGENLHTVDISSSTYLQRSLRMPPYVLRFFYVLTKSDGNF